MEKILFKEEQRFRQRWMWLILVSALQLYFKNGKKLLIGTQKKQAIEFAMRKIMGENKNLSTGERNSQQAEGVFGKKAKKILIILAIEIVVVILIFGIIQVFK